jgi:hypothetical protein
MHDRSNLVEGLDPRRMPERAKDGSDDFGVATAASLDHGLTPMCDSRRASLVLRGAKRSGMRD